LVMGTRFRVSVAALLAVLMVGLLIPAAMASSGAGAPTGLTVGLPTSSGGGCLKLDWRVSDPTSITGYKVYRSGKAAFGAHGRLADFQRGRVPQVGLARLRPGQHLGL